MGSLHLAKCVPSLTGTHNTFSSGLDEMLQGSAESLAHRRHSINVSCCLCQHPKCLGGNSGPKEVQLEHVCLSFTHVHVYVHVQVRVSMSVLCERGV